jgi:hypothetical protein
MALWVSWACAGDAVTPVPIAHTGSYAITTWDAWTHTSTQGGMSRRGHS